MVTKFSGEGNNEMVKREVGINKYGQERVEVGPEIEYLEERRNAVIMGKGLYRFQGG